MKQLVTIVGFLFLWLFSFGQTSLNTVGGEVKIIQVQLVTR
jgi:hypothetical protein